MSRNSDDGRQFYLYVDYSFNYLNGLFFNYYVLIYCFL